MSTKKQPEAILSATIFNLELGGHIYTLNFGTATFIRIKEEKPELPTAFHVVDEIPTMEAIPFLIYCAIKPSDRQFVGYDSFLELYDECDDSDSISKVIPAYISALGRVVKKITPALAALEKMQTGSEKK